MRALLPLALLAVAVQSKLINTRNPTICDPNVKQYAGHNAIDNSTKEYFYWAFEARTKSANTPTILWMTGGPGCSSELALLFENGPCHVNAEGTGTTLNPYSWNSFANLVFIDQPAGVGFSTGVENDRNEKDVADDMYAFLQDFFKEHPDWNTEFFVWGESYGGHYAPATAHRVWKGAQAGEGIKINLAGLGVGNGLVDPEIQYNFYAQLAYNWSIEVTGKPVISLATYEAMTASIPSCIASIKRCNNGGSDADCTASQSLCNADMLNPYTATGMNPYDIRKKCTGSALCYNFTSIDTYLNSKQLQDAIGVKGKWVSCNDQVNADFSADWMKDFQTKIPDLLENGVRVLIYAGDVDFICNWLGNKAWSLALPWSGTKGFQSAGDNAWHTAGGKKSGMYRTHNGFSFVQVHLAGHMVPHDQPEAALSMVNTFVHNKKWE